MLRTCSGLIKGFCQIRRSVQWRHSPELGLFERPGGRQRQGGLTTVIVGISMAATSRLLYNELKVLNTPVSQRILLHLQAPKISSLFKGYREGD